jgi:hypothetical protein
VSENAALDALMERAATDPELRARLEADPGAVLAEEGITLSETDLQQAAAGFAWGPNARVSIRKRDFSWTEVNPDEFRSPGRAPKSIIE